MLCSQPSLFKLLVALLRVVLVELRLLLAFFKLCQQRASTLLLNPQFILPTRQPIYPHAQIVILIKRQRHAPCPQFAIKLDKLACLRRLAFHQPQPPLSAFKLFARHLQVRFGPLEPARCFNPPLLVLRYPRRFLKNHPPFLRTRHKHGINLALLDDRIRVRTHARIKEQLANVLESCRFAVDQIVAAPIAIQPPLNLHDVIIHRQRPTILPSNPSGPNRSSNRVDRSRT